jgi:hypothetical protein
MTDPTDRSDPSDPSDKDNMAEEPHPDSLRRHVLALLRGGQAYDPFEEIVASFGPDERGIVPPGADRSAWQILEHMRIALRDILDFSRARRGQYLEIRWPDDYWPREAAPPEADSWDHSVESYLVLRGELERLVSDPDRDLFEPVPAGDGQTLLREALLAADHASYHLGQLVALERWIRATP